MLRCANTHIYRVYNKICCAMLIHKMSSILIYVGFCQEILLGAPFLTARGLCGRCFSDTHTHTQIHIYIYKHTDWGDKTSRGWRTRARETRWMMYCSQCATPNEDECFFCRYLCLLISGDAPPYMHRLFGRPARKYQNGPQSANGMFFNCNSDAQMLYTSRHTFQKLYISTFVGKYFFYLK